MSITAYWKTTTGFNVNAYPVILGKSLKSCTSEELAAHPMCGSNSPLSNISYTIKYSELSSSTLGRVAMNLTGGAQFKTPLPNNMANTWACEAAPTGDNAKVYRRIIFVACPTNVSFPSHCISDDCNENILIVENIASPNKLVAAFGNPSYSDGMTTTFSYSVYLRHVCENPHSVWASAPNQVQYTDESDPDNPVIKSYYIYPVFLYVIGEHVFLIRDDYIGNFGGLFQNATSNYNWLSGGSSYYNFDTDDDYCLFLGQNVNGTGGETDLTGIFGDVFADPVPNPPVFINSPITYEPTTILNLNLKFKYALTSSTVGGIARNTTLAISSAGATSMELRRQQMARSGVYFVENGRIFKPIISGGIVTTYGTAEVPSEIDKYTDLNHPVPTGPGGGGGGDDDDPWHGVDFGGTGAGGGGAFCSVYYMTGAELTSLKNWSNTSAPENFDMLPSIIGLQQLPVALSGVPTTVKFLKSGAITSQGESRVVDTGVSAGTGTGQPVSFSLGSVNINRRMQQRGEPYLDYDCTVELFLPFAGTFVLDTQAVMGRTINAEIVIDPVNGTAFSYAWVSQGGQKMPIAYGGGSIAVDLPIASNQWGISRAAFKQASHQMTMNAIKDIGDFIIGLGISKTGQAGAIANRSGYAALDIKEGLQAKQIGGQMMTSSTINAATDTASAIVNAHQLNNTNYTAIRGSFGGSYAEWAQPFTAYVRITRPKFKKPSNFNHTQAVPCVETKTVGSCSGLTICVNPDCGSISCTEAEKIMITQALVGGVYAGGGQ